MSNIINTNSSARTLTIPNLVNGQIYRARVSAVNNYGQGPFANWIQVTPSEFSTPSAPTNVVANLLGLSVGLNWTDPASNGGSAITGYVVQFSQNGGSWTTTTLTPLSGYRGYFDGDTDSFNYAFRVAAVNSVGTGSFSSPSNAVGGF